MAVNKDTGAPEGIDAVGRPLPGSGQNPYTNSDSGNSGKSSQQSGGAGTAGGATQDASPGRPEPTK